MSAEIKIYHKNMLFITALKEQKKNPDQIDFASVLLSQNHCTVRWNTENCRKLLLQAVDSDCSSTAEYSGWVTHTVLLHVVCSKMFVVIFKCFILSVVVGQTEHQTVVHTTTRLSRVSNSLYLCGFSFILVPQRSPLILWGFFNSHKLEIRANITFLIKRINTIY